MGNHYRNKASVVYCEECGQGQVSFGGAMTCQHCQRKTVFAEFIPTLDQIRAKCESIQKTWSRGVRRARSAYKTGCAFQQAHFPNKRDERTIADNGPIRMYKNRDYVSESF